LYINALREELAMPQAKLVVKFQDLGAEKATPDGLTKLDHGARDVKMEYEGRVRIAASHRAYSNGNA
jgi:hypothetical protein